MRRSNNAFRGGVVRSVIRFELAEKNAVPMCAARVSIRNHTGGDAERRDRVRIVEETILLRRSEQE